MSTTATKTDSGPKALPWIRYSEDVTRWLDSHLGGADRTKILDRFCEDVQGPAATVQIRPAAEPATAPMIQFIDNLLAEREHPPLADDVIESIKADKAQAHRFITFLKAQPRVVVEAPARVRLDFKAISDGNYAVRKDGVVKFYRVSTSKTGFKNVQVRASDDLHMLSAKAGIAVLHHIVEAGLAESRMLFATELGRCWRCGKSLTDEESRARGMGPDCASR